MGGGGKAPTYNGGRVAWRKKNSEGAARSALIIVSTGQVKAWRSWNVRPKNRAGAGARTLARRATS